MSSDQKYQVNHTNMPKIENLSLKELDAINDRCKAIFDLQVESLSKDSPLNVFSLNASLEKHCKALQSIVKKLAAENNLEKIVESESLLVSMSSKIESLRVDSSAHARNVADFIKQSDALSNVLKFLKYFKNYDDYVKIMDTTTNGAKNLEKYGLPEDNVCHNLNNNILSLKNSLKLNSGPTVFDNLTDTRIKVLNRARILYMQRQIPLMVEFSVKNSDRENTFAYVFLLNRAGIEKNVQTLLDKSDEVLGIQKEQEQTQTQTQQTQEQTSNKKAKSSPDIEL